MTRILQVSDTHLSRTHPLFQFNFEITLREIERIKPDLVIYTGDLSLNGPDNPDDVSYAHEQIRRTAATHFALPGNHDIGLSPVDHADGLHAEQLVNEARLGHYRNTFAYDRFKSDVGGWRIIGLNSQLLGSGLPGEAEQNDWFADALNCDKPVALFMHYPVFVHDPDSTTDGHYALPYAARQQLLTQLVRAGNVRMVGTGHLHQAKSTQLVGMRFEWAPSSAFVIPGPALDAFGGNQVTGMLLHELDGDRVRTTTIEPDLIINVDLRNWSKSKPHGYYQVVRQPWLLDREPQREAA